jgi:hypothetical protein
MRNIRFNPKQIKLINAKRQYTEELQKTTSTLL